MINFFQTREETTEAGIICFLKNIFNETENIHDPYSAQEDILDAKGKQERYNNLLELTEQNWNSWLEQKEHDTEPSSYPVEKLHDVVLSNLYLRNGQCEEQKFHNTSESYKKALELLRKHRPPEKNSIKGANGEDTLLNLLIHLNLGKYMRNMSYFESRSRFSLASHEFEKVKSFLEGEKNFQNQNHLQIWLEAKTNIGKCQKNLYELEKSKTTFQGVVSGLLPWVSVGRKNIFEQKHLKLNLSQPSETEKIIYAHLKDEKQLADLFFIRALIQLAIICRKQRDYETAKAICQIVIDMEPENIDALNNLGVCYRKDGEFEDAINQFQDLMEKGDRFATINYWKSILRLEESDQEKRHASKEEIQKFLGQDKPNWEHTLLQAQNEQDWEHSLIQGRFLQLQKDLKMAYAIFEKLYEKYPFIHYGTIGLKAYYNMAACLMQEGKYQQAKGILDEILNTCPDDRLSMIDKGWCLMQTNQYKAAKDLYLDVMNLPQNWVDSASKTLDTIGTTPGSADKTPDSADETPDPIINWKNNCSLSTYEQVKQLNNLGECYLRIGDIQKASILFQRVLDEESNNIEALNFKAQCLMQEGEQLEKAEKYDDAAEKYNMAIAFLEDAILKRECVDPDRKERLPLISHLIIAKAAYVQAVNKKNAPLLNREGQPAETLISKEYLEYYLLYYPDASYSQKACCEFAEFLLDSDHSNSRIPDQEALNRYRAFSRIHLWKKEEGCEKFSHFIKSPEFMSTGASKRGKILAWLFLIYRDVRKIKDACRYSPKASCHEILIPAHYTSLNTLKKLAAEENAYLRLWNSVYMNDPNEGSCFLELLKATCNNLPEQENADAALSKYFPHLNNTKENLSPTNSNVYITSFCREKDDLQMWRLYGDDAKGCSLVFADDFFDIRSRIEGPLDLTEYSDHDYPLYEVQYIDEEKLMKDGEIKIISGKKTETSSQISENRTLQMNETKAAQIKKHLESIWKHITSLQNWMAEKKEEIKPNSAAAVTAFLADALNEIRFLFKYSYFEKEEELRLVQFSYHPKFEHEAFPIPRMYINVEREIQLKEVMLGTKIKAQRKDEIVSWLYATGKVEKVTESQKHYK